MRDEPKFGRVKKSLSKDAIEFTMMCLNKDPKMRASAEDLLNHKWLNNNVEETEIDKEVADEIINDLAAFRK